MKKVIAINVFDMKEKQTFGIQFVGRKNRDKEKHFTIFARNIVNGEVSEISLKQNIPLIGWNPVAGMGKGRKAGVRELKQFLDQVRTRLSNIYREQMVEGDLPTIAMVKNHFLGIVEQGKSIFDAFDYHKKIAQGDLSDNTV
ncbi:MAG: Arm DNA-binding domain-containing protein [Prolixibacteraceae bacterium]